MVNAIVDTLKTAFPRSEPQSPTEDNEAEIDGGKITGDKKSKYDSTAAFIHTCPHTTPYREMRLKFPVLLY